MEFRELQTLAKLAELHSITAVARASELSPPTVHKYLKSLEAELGVVLYTTNKRSLQLTTAARALVPHVNEVLSSHLALCEAADDWRECRRGVVRCGAGPSFCTALLPALVKRFRKEFPGIDVFVRSGNGRDLLQELQNGMLDCVIGLPPTTEHHGSLSIGAVWRAEAALVASPALVRSRASREDLNKLRFIAFQEHSAMDILVGQYLMDLELRPKIVMRSDSGEAIKAMLRVGLGVSVLFLWSVARDLRKGALKRIPIAGRALSSTFVLVRAESTAGNRGVNNFITLARAMTWPYLEPVLATGAAVHG